MGLSSFLEDLFHTGRVRVRGIAPLSDEEIAAADSLLRSAEQAVRLEAPGEPPPFSVVAARWGATMLYRGAQALVYRDVAGEDLATLLRDRCPEPANPATHYSVDLTLRYLPDLLGLARRVSERDALVEQLLELGADWPLSSIGIDGIAVHDPGPILDDPCLLRMYADRMIQKRDLSRLNDERVREAARRAIGAFPELAPDVMRALESEPAEKPPA